MTSLNKSFTAIEYIAIDIANAYGLDKLTFEERIQWVRTHSSTLEQLTEQAEEPHLYFKAVNAFRTALQGKPVGHTVALDACCSGLQLMSVLTGCESGCYLTGLIAPNERTDAYTLICEDMNQQLHNPISIKRKDAKDAVMQTFYGSVSIASKLFGHKTPAYYAFYNSLKRLGVGAWWLLQELKSAWNTDALAHSWVLPDGYVAHVPVMVKQETRVAIAELNYTMSVEYYDNQSMESGISLPANTIHSLDAYVLRSLVRRCNYNPNQVNQVLNLIEIELLQRGLDLHSVGVFDETLERYIQLWLKTAMVDVVIINHINQDNLWQLSTDHLRALSRVLTQVLTHEPFEVITVHDSYATHANHCNRVRYWYKEILASIAESNLLESLLSQLLGEDIKFKPLNPNLGAAIRNSNYGLC